MKELFGAILLACGLSSRMGKDKASLEIEGKTLLESLLSILYPIVEETIVVRASGQSIPKINNELETVIL